MVSPFLPCPPPSSSPQQSQPKQPSEKSRSKKGKEAKPKVKKLKYHQYVPPDQKAEASEAPMDSSYARILEQQQLFLQLQIISQQQQHYNYQTILPAPLKYVLTVTILQLPDYTTCPSEVCSYCYYTTTTRLYLPF